MSETKSPVNEESSPIAFLPDVLYSMVTHLVENPDQVVIKQTESFRTVVLSVTVSPSDVGKVIGKKGRTAESIRLLLSNMGGRLGYKVIFDVFLYGEGGKSVPAEKKAA